MPFKPAGFIDLLECFEIFGHAKFGSDWTGSEHRIEQLPAPKERESWIIELADQFERHRFERSESVHNYEEHFTSQYGEPYPEGYLGVLSLLQRIPVWGQKYNWPKPWMSLDPRSDEYQSMYIVWKRKEDVETSLRQALYAGAIHAYRFRTTGTLSIISLHNWGDNEFWFNHFYLTEKNLVLLSQKETETYVLGEIPSRQDGEDASKGDTVNLDPKKNKRGRKPGSGKIDDFASLERAKEKLGSGEYTTKWSVCDDDEVQNLTIGQSRPAIQKRLYDQLKNEQSD